MKHILVPLLVLSIAGCAIDEVKVDAPAVIKYKYVINTVPDEMLVKPDPIPRIDPAVATDKDAANWMLESEKRYMIIEKRFDAVKQYLQEKIMNFKIPAEDVIKN